MSEDYMLWLGSGDAEKAIVYTIDNDGNSVDPYPESNWGSLKRYLPMGETKYSASRSIHGKPDDPCLMVGLGSNGWEEEIKSKIIELEFRFKGEQSYKGHDSLEDANIQVMDAGRQLNFDFGDWQQIAGYNVELFRTIMAGKTVPVYTLKFYLENKSNTSIKVAAFWCWE